MRVSNSYNRRTSINVRGIDNQSDHLVSDNRLMSSLDNSLIDEKKETSPLQNGDKTKFYYQKIVNLEFSLGLVVLINLLLVLTYSEQTFSSSGVYPKDTYDTTLYITTGCTIIEIYISFTRIVTQLNFQKEQKIVHANETLFTTRMFYSWMLEMFIFLLQPNLWCNKYSVEITAEYTGQTYTLYVNEILSLLSLLRFYVLIRLFLFRSVYMNPRSHRLCKMHGCQANYEYALKCLFKDSPALLILLFFTASIILFAYAIQLCERPLFRSHPKNAINLENFGNAIWFTMITMTTVGFGDYYPITPFGRLIILFVVVWGIFIVSIMVVVVTHTLQMDKTQKKSLIVIKRLEVSNQLREAAGEYINFVISGIIRKRKGEKIENEQEILQRQKKKYELKQRFYKLNAEKKNLHDNDDTYEQISQKFQQLNDDIKILNQNQQQLIRYIHQNLQFQNESLAS